MRIGMICCPFKTSFGAYGSALQSALEARGGNIAVQWVASNCGCGDPIEAGRQFQSNRCDFFELPMPTGYRSKHAWRRCVRDVARSAMVYLRTQRYSSLLDQPDVVHFQQVLNGYGSRAVFSWLKHPTSAARVVTVHELDPDQLEFSQTNIVYNRADAIIVHCEEMRHALIGLKVNPAKIHVVLYGTAIPSPDSHHDREGIVFYGGHKIMSGKGLETLFRALALVRERRSRKPTLLRIHGHYGSTTPFEAQQMANAHGVADNVVWLNQIPEDAISELYQSSEICVLPFTKSFAGMAAAAAAACQLPVIATRKAGLPDYLQNDGIWIEEDNAPQLAERILELLDNESRQREIGARLLQRAKQHLSWEVIADQTLGIYADVIGERVRPAAA